MVWTGIAYWHFFGRLETNHMPLLSDDSAILVCRNGSILVHRSLLLPPNTLSGIKISHTCVCGQGSAPDPAVGAYSAPWDAIAGWVKGGGQKGKGRKGRGIGPYQYFFFPHFESWLLPTVPQFPKCYTYSILGCTNRQQQQASEREINVCWSLGFSRSTNAKCWKCMNLT